MKIILVIPRIMILIIITISSSPHHHNYHHHHQHHQHQHHHHHHHHHRHENSKDNNNSNNSNNNINISSESNSKNINKDENNKTIIVTTKIPTTRIMMIVVTAVKRITITTIPGIEKVNEIRPICTPRPKLETPQLGAARGAGRCYWASGACLRSAPS